MSKVVVGIDPDSNSHGVALYRDGKLEDISLQTTIELLDYIDVHQVGCEILVSMENVLANKFVYSRNNKGSKAATSKIAMGIGRCQQAQFELMRWFDHMEVTYILHSPTIKNWAKDKKQFEARTGWSDRSNVDNRSAAYFGFVAL